MDLHRDDPCAGNLRIALGVVDGQLVIDPEPHPISLTADAVVVPVVHTQHATTVAGSGPSQHAVASRLVVETAPPAVPHIGLIAADFMMVGDLGGADLHAGIGCVTPAKLELQAEFEVVVRLIRAEKLIAGDRLLQRSRDDGFLLNPKPLEVAVPAVERLAVKERREVGLCGRGFVWLWLNFAVGNFTNPQLPVRGLHLFARLHLQGDDAPAGHLLGFHVVDGEGAVEPDADSWAFAADAVVVPLRREGGRELCGGQEAVTPRLVVEPSPVALAEVRLIAGGHAVVTAE